jgi:hypothetical protein
MLITILIKCPIQGKLNLFFKSIDPYEKYFYRFSFSEDVGSINGIETISLKSRNSHPTQSQSEV